ncbi:short-chain dehydrogenase/reductase family 16C member 6-like isoform X2 [Linepithema humile]|uniref:short-chain dehydrogenase/reductase family 16C member 6-like isoform X2 n=1 Tax=Linepithema humile TaxID=83485 RepID=UPI00351E2BA2
MALYDGMLLLAEIFVLFFQILYYICESIYKLFAPVEKKSVAGEIVLVTGAGHGIGKELAIGYALLGATVICWDINEEANQQTKNEIKKMGKDSVYAYRCDVTNREEVFKVAKKVKKEVGDVNILINNAGIGIFKTFLNYNDDEILRTINGNLIAHYWTLRAFLPSMIEKNHGHVVAVSSLLAIVMLMYATVYSSTKIAVRAFMESLNEELRISSKGKSLIKFTTVFPTVVFNGMLKKPIVKFPSLISPLLPKEVASLIIDAQRENCRERNIPSYLSPLLTILKNLPIKAQECLKDAFIGTITEPDD